MLENREVLVNGCLPFKRTANVIHIWPVCDFNGLKIASFKLAKSSKSIGNGLNQATLHEWNSSLVIDLLDALVKVLDHSVLFDDISIFHDDIDGSEYDIIGVKEALEKVAHILNFSLTKLVV